MKTCSKCGKDYGPSGFIRVNSSFFNGELPICRQCLQKMVDDVGETEKWNVVNKICQWADIPFIPNEWQKLYESDGSDAIGPYFAIFRSKEFENLSWNDYNKLYLQLQEENNVAAAIPMLEEAEFNKLRYKWGLNYDDEDLRYLEQLHQGLLEDQNVIGTLSKDQSLKLCKISLIIDNKIREGLDFDKELKTYDSLIKITNFTPKESKNGEDFDSVGEIGSYLEKTGFVNQYYDGAVRDEVDNTMKNFQNWARRLYTNESGIGEEITERIQNLKAVNQMESDYTDEMLDSYEMEGYNKEILEEFEADLDED